MKNYEMIRRVLFNAPLAILPSKLDEIVAAFELRVAGVDVAYGQSDSPSPHAKGNVAVISIMGTIFPHAGMLSRSSGGTSSEEIINAVNEVAADPSVGTVIFRVRSPGGAVPMIKEASNAIAALRRTGKKTVASADHMAASAALWLMSQVEEKVATPSGEIGSLGVLAQHVDYSQADARDGIKTTIIKSSKYKNEANPYEPLGDEAKSEIQRRVNQLHDMFVDDVARGYGITPMAVNKNFGEGRMFSAEEAKARGIISRIETFDETIARLTGMKRRVDAKGAADLSRRRMAV
jgi:capsid assembly protease